MYVYTTELVLSPRKMCESTVNQLTNISVLNCIITENVCCCIATLWIRFHKGRLYLESQSKTIDGGPDEYLVGSWVRLNDRCDGWLDSETIGIGCTTSLKSHIASELHIFIVSILKYADICIHIMLNQPWKSLTPLSQKGGHLFCWERQMQPVDITRNIWMKPTNILHTKWIQNAC